MYRGWPVNPGKIRRKLDSPWKKIGKKQLKI